MSARDFSESYGYDEVNPYDEIPISFGQAQLASGRPAKLSRGEYPRLDAPFPAGEPQQVRQSDVTRKVVAPRGMIEGFTGQITISQQDQQMIIIFLLIIVVVMQMRIMMQNELVGHGVAHQPNLPR